MAKKIHDAIFSVPANIPYSMPVRYWGEGILVGLITPLVVYPATLAALWAIPGQDLIPLARALPESMKAVFYAISWGSSFADTVKPFLEDVGLGNTLGMGLRFLTAGIATAWATYKVTASSLTPRTNVRHLSGPRLLEDEEAIEEAIHRSLSPKEAEADIFSMRLHPHLHLPKKFWSRHMLVYGSVGSGKSVILKYILKQIIRMDAKCFIYDVKGDFTSIFRKPIIVSPFDKRSYVWDVACDVRTLSQATEFARSIIPPEPNASSSYWADAPREILVGVLIELQINKPLEWTWMDLSQMLLRNAEQFKEGFMKYYPQAVTYVEGGGDNQTVQSVLSSLSSKAKFAHDLARAWPVIKKKRRFAITEWIKDDYNGRKQVIVQSGPDSGLTAAYISALINIATTEIISPVLPDNEGGRFLGFVFDEMSSVGKLNIESLVNKGRSKGCVCIFAVQDFYNQLSVIYGKEETAALASMVGSHVVCQTQMGETRDKLAELLGKRKIAWFSHGDKSSAAHEENKGLVASPQITDDLGFKRGKKYGKEKWGIRAIVQMSGDVLMLDWPGVNYPVVRAGQEQAKWVTENTHMDSVNRPQVIVDPNAHLSSDEMTMPIADEEEALWVKKQLEQQFPEVLASTPSGAFLKARDALLNAAPELTAEQQANLELKQRIQQGIDERTKNIEKHLKGKLEIDPDNDPFGLLDSESFTTVEPEEEEEDDEGVEGVQANAMAPKISISDLDELMNQAKLKR